MLEDFSSNAKDNATYSACEDILRAVLFLLTSSLHVYHQGTVSSSSALFRVSRLPAICHKRLKAVSSKLNLWIPEYLVMVPFRSDLHPSYSSITTFSFIIILPNGLLTSAQTFKVLSTDEVQSGIASNP
ncbi:hypothetical protein Tco_0183802 [Tanacetum coccineum]